MNENWVTADVPPLSIRPRLRVVLGTMAGSALAAALMLWVANSIDNLLLKRVLLSAAIAVSVSLSSVATLRVLRQESQSIRKSRSIPISPPLQTEPLPDPQVRTERSLQVFRDGEGARQRILAAVAANSGMSVRQLCDKLDLSWSTVAYHLGVLRQRGAVRAIKDGRDLRLFPVNRSFTMQLAQAVVAIPDRSQHEIRTWLRVLREADAECILAAILETPNQGVYQLSAQLGLSHKVVRGHLKRLQDAGLVEKLGEYRPRYRGTVPVPRFLETREGLGRPRAERTQPLEAKPSSPESSGNLRTLLRPHFP